ncbi:hypothetical protein [Hydrogenophaga electricum]|uniref:Uncharacterized protein n=1 Tax=Hydrogenophaga electricum TaxID=1230953 RepID=A0ABQ6C177_9BURK|nr:hypothetical protein [Hydrogenophaga electricum]GLS13620.1 hypothetical protein GCM10007935_10500 [Hydrogenophaga electricum]
MASIRILPLIAATSIAACTDRPPPPPDTALREPMPPEVAEVIQPAWPKVLKACPGLQRYWSDLENAGTEDNRSFAPPEARRVSLLLKVAGSPKTIPGAFGAQGHTCTFEVTPDGSTLTVPKLACASVCLGEDADPHIPMRTRVLRLPLVAD